MPSNRPTPASIPNNRNNNQKEGNEMTATPEVSTPNVPVDSNSETPNPVSVAGTENGKGDLDADFYVGFYAQTVENANKHNALLDAVLAAGDRVAITDMLKDKPEQTEDENFIAIAKRRAEISDALEEAEKAFAEAAKPFIDTHLKKSGVEGKLAEADELAKKVKATQQFFTQMSADTSGIPTLKNRSGRTSGSGDGRGAGVTKYRNLDVYVDGKRAEQKQNVKQADGTTKPEMRSNLTYGAQNSNVTPEVFRAAFLAAQGTDDKDKFKDSVEFEVTDPKGGKHSVKVNRIPQV